MCIELSRMFSSPWLHGAILRYPSNTHIFKRTTYFALSPLIKDQLLIYSIRRSRFNYFKCMIWINQFEWFSNSHICVCLTFISIKVMEQITKSMIMNTRITAIFLLITFNTWSNVLHFQCPSNALHIEFSSVRRLIEDWSTIKNDFDKNLVHYNHMMMGLNIFG